MGAAKSSQSPASPAPPYDGGEVAPSRYTWAELCSQLRSLGQPPAAGATPDEMRTFYNKLAFLLYDPQFSNPHYVVLIRMLETVKAIFQSESHLVECEPPLTIVGDLHGSNDAFERIYGACVERVGASDYKPAHITHSFVFLGNYIDHGDNSLYVLLNIFCMKIATHYSGRKLVMLRGNHETREINYAHGFRAELHSKYNKEQADDLFDRFNDIFNHMPLACLIGNRHLCVHGGISPALTSFEAIRRIPKPLERPDKNKLACDLLWADYNEELRGFEPNEDRDISVCFGPDVLQATVDRLGVEFLIRSHQKVLEGVRSDDSLVTITSSSRKNTNLSFGIVRVLEDGSVNPCVQDPEQTGDFIIQLEACEDSL